MYNYDYFIFVLLGVVIAVGIAVLRVRRKGIKQFYDNVAVLLGDSRIIYPNFFTFGNLNGNYEGREIEIHCWIIQGRMNRGKTAAEAKLRLLPLTPTKENETPHRVRHLNDHMILDLEDRSILYRKIQLAPLDVTQIQDMLNEMRTAAENYESGRGNDGDPIKCLSCGVIIAVGESKCPKCGWSWM